MSRICEISMILSIKELNYENLQNDEFYFENGEGWNSFGHLTQRLIL